MECLCFYNGVLPLPPSRTNLLNFSYRISPFTQQSPLHPSLSVSCRRRTTGEGGPLSSSSAYDILGVDPSCSDAELKVAFRSKVKQYHPDVSQVEDGEFMIRQVIQAYEMLSNCSRSEIIERECLDPFDEPECEALDLFVNELLCVGKGCSYSCVKTAPNAFTFASSSGTARATSQGNGEDYRVQTAVG